MSTSDGDDVPRDPWGNPLPPEDRAPLNPGPDDFLPPFPSDPPAGADPAPTAPAAPPAAPENPAWPGPRSARPASPPGPPPFAPPAGTEAQAPPPAPPTDPAWPGDQPTRAVPPPPAPPEPYPGQPYPGQAAPGQAYPGQPGPGWGGPGVPPQHPAYPPGQPGGWGPGAPWVQPKRDGMAVGAFVCSLVGLLCFSVVLEPVALVLGIVARKRIRESGGTLTGDGLALAAIIIGAIGFVFGIASMIYVARNPDAFNFDQIFKNLTTTTGG